MSDPINGNAEPAPTPRTPEDLVTPPGLPRLGKWLFDPGLAPAHWLGATHEGKRLREPIRAGFVNLENVIVADPAVTTGDHDGMAVVLIADE